MLELLLDEKHGCAERQRWGIFLGMRSSRQPLAERLVSFEDEIELLEPDTSSEARSEGEWLAEVERRARAATAGSPSIPWEEAKAELERRFGRL